MAIKTTTGRINEGHELIGLIDPHQAYSGVLAYTDCSWLPQYGMIENDVACQNSKRRTPMTDRLTNSPGNRHRDGIYPESGFCYRPESDIFLYLAGQEMKPRGVHSLRLS